MTADIIIDNRFIVGLANYAYHDASFSSTYGDSVVDLDVSKLIFSYNKNSKLVRITALTGLPKDFKMVQDKSHFLSRCMILHYTSGLRAI